MKVQRPAASQFQQPFDVIVVGGGINGSGIARDAAERGMRVLLVDKNDFGSGTTAYSSRLIHGGLRYLENLEFDLVHESLQERKRLLQNAPHLVKPLPLGIPVYNTSKRPRWFVELGMILYDVLARLSGSALVPLHRIYGKTGFLKQFQGVNGAGMTGGFRYFDAQVTLPERLCVENAKAAEAHGAVVMNHAVVSEITVENKTAKGIRFEDVLTGEQFVATGKVVVNAAGPWVDDVLKLAKPVFPQMMGGTKGTHIVVNQFEGGPKRALYVEASDGRPYFIIPWLGYYLIGTTDLPYQGNLNAVEPTEEEINYLLKETNQVLPKARLKRNDVLYSYAGVRPLPKTDAKTPGKITRKHIIRDHGKEDGVENLISIIGGKLTTYRNLAEETVTHIQKKWKLGTQPCTTQNTPLPGAVGITHLSQYKGEQTPFATAEYGVSEETVHHLIDLYGNQYKRVLELVLQDPRLKRPLKAGELDIGAQVVDSVRHEFVRSSDDFLQRRSALGLKAGNGLDSVEMVATLIGNELGWSAAQIAADATAYRQKVALLNKPSTPVPV